MQPLAPPGLERGAQLGRYIIEERLGAGTAGIIYVAQDPRLGRRVAVKVLNAVPGEAPDRTRARLLREAKALARVSHAAVVRIHDVGATDDQVFIAMELIEGVSLRRWLEAAPRSTIEVLKVLLCVGEGLAAAHATGIVHRDVTPENIVVSADGRGRVLDFGLARDVSLGGATHAGSAQASTSTAAGTRSHLRTTGYMAPEQYVGRRSDARTDQFSFCVCLYEALHGHRPFRGDDPLALARQTMSRTDGRTIPAGLERILRRGLEASPEHRYPRMEPMLAALARYAVERRARWRVPAMAAASLLVAVLGWRAMRQARTPTGGVPGSLARHRQLTFSGDVTSHAISPDGKSLAYFSGGKFMLSEIGPGTARILWDPAATGPVVAQNDPAWAPDGKRLVLSWSDDVRTHSVIVHTGGGPARPLTEYAHQAAWSPDGQRIAFVPNMGADHTVGFLSGDGAVLAPVRLQADFELIADLAWSPQSDRVLVATRRNHGSTLLRIDPGGASEERLAEEPAGIQTVAWRHDGRAIYYLRDRDDHPQLIELLLGVDDRPAAVPALHGLELGASLSMSRDGQRLAYSRRSPRSNLHAVTLRGRGDIATRCLTIGTRLLRGLSISPDGRELAFAASDGNASEVFTMAVSGGAAKRLTSIGATVQSTAWSPDGKRLAFTLQRSGTHRVWTIDRSGGAAREHAATEVGFEPGSLTWAPGAEILYQTPGNQRYRALEPDASTTRALLGDGQGRVFDPQWSPDRQSLAVLWNGAPARRGLWIVRPGEGAERRLSAEPLMPIGWSEDGGTVYAQNQGNLVFTIPIQAGTPTPLLTLPFEAPKLDGVVMTPDAKTFLVLVDETVSDAWLVEGF